MATIQSINIGTSANDNTGDTLRNAFDKTNQNNTALNNDLALKATLASPTITGTLTTVNDAVINSVKVGKGGGNIATNTVVGVGAGQSNTTGNNNTSIGASASANTQSGQLNTAIGAQAMVNNDGGSSCVAVGVNALQNQVALVGNTAVGVGALSNNTLYNNVGGFGESCQANGSDQIVLGNTAINALRCNVQTITSLSDGRDKTDIVEITEGLEFINKLKPVTFTWNQRDEGRVGIKSAGFIAQDLLELQNDSLIGENLDLVSDLNPEQLEARYTNLLPIMIKAIQELTERINVLEGN
jgi:hypothetical protein